MIYAYHMQLNDVCGCYITHLTTNSLQIFNVYLSFAWQDDGWEVEFEIGHDDDGKVKAISVTAPGGGPCFGPRKPRVNRRRENKDGSGGDSSNSARGPAKPKDPFWHESLEDGVKSMLEEKNIRTTTGTIDVSVGDSRVKLGTNGYSSMAHAEGVLAEGSFTCDTDGNAAFTWEHCINFDKASGEWIAPGDKSVLPTAFGLADGESYLILSTISMRSILLPDNMQKDAYRMFI